MFLEILNVTETNFDFESVVYSVTVYIMVFTEGPSAVKNNVVTPEFPGAKMLSELLHFEIQRSVHNFVSPTHDDFFLRKSSDLDRLKYLQRSTKTSPYFSDQNGGGMNGTLLDLSNCVSDTRGHIVFFLSKPRANLSLMT